MKTAVITGASSGIGEATAAAFFKHGYRVYNLSRHAGKDSRILHLPCDVTDDRQVQECFAKIGNGIDVLVCNAGMGISGAAAWAEMTDVRRIFGVNTLGAMSCVTAARPYLAQNASVILITSVAASFSIPFQVYYSATKAATAAFARGLRMELRDLGIQVCAVSPGDVNTGFTDARRKSNAGTEVYGQGIEKAVAAMEKDERTGMRAEQVANVILRTSERRNPPPVVTVGTKYKLFIAISKLLPARLIDYLLCKLYR